MYIDLCQGFPFQSVSQCAFLCQYYVVFITITLLCNLKLAIVTTPAVPLCSGLFYLFLIFCFWFQMKLKFFLLRSVRNCVEFLMGNALIYRLILVKMIIFTILILWSMNIKDVSIFWYRLQFYYSLPGFAAKDLL